MAVNRSFNFLGQARIDTPHMRSLESAICADFDLLAGQVMAGSRPLIITGFDLVTTGAVGSVATTLQLNVAGGILFHPNGSEAGTFFSVAEGTAVEVLSGTNPLIDGSFTPNQVNFIGLDLCRAADDTTSDLVEFLDANTLTETPLTVPLGRTLSYRIIIGITDFSSDSTIMPIAKVTTDAGNVITLIEDARYMMFRLGSGGTVPDDQYSYTWSQNRHEPTNNLAGAKFQGGDKAITSQKDFFDALMTRLWELGGGEYWYSPTSDRDMKLVLGQPVLAVNSDNFCWLPAPGPQTIAWSGLVVAFANSTAYFNTITDNIAGVVLHQGYCIYVDVDRSTNGAVLTVPAPVPLTTLGSPVVPGSRFVLAWRLGNYVWTRTEPYETGRQFKAATIVGGSSGLGVVRVSQTPSTGAEYIVASSDGAPVALALDANGQAKNTAKLNNSYSFRGTGVGSGGGAYFTGGSTDGSGALLAGGGNLGFGALIYGAANTAAGSAGAYTITAHAHTAGPAVGAVVWGGSNTNGGDGINAFARGDGTVVRHGVVAAGSNPHLNNNLNCTGGDGVRAYGGPSTDAFGAVKSEGGYFIAGTGAISAVGGGGLYAEGGVGSGNGGTGIGILGGAGPRLGGLGIYLQAGTPSGLGGNGGEGIELYATDGNNDVLGGVANIKYPGFGGFGGSGIYIVAGGAGAGDAAGLAGDGAYAEGGHGASALTAVSASPGGVGFWGQGGLGGAIGAGSAAGDGGAGIFGHGGHFGHGGTPISGFGGWFVGGDHNGTGLLARASDAPGDGGWFCDSTFDWYTDFNADRGAYGIQVAGTTGAIRIHQGEISYSGGFTRRLIISAQDMNEISGSPIGTWQTETGCYYKTFQNAAGGGTYDVNFTVHLPAGSVITGFEVLASNDNAGPKSVILRTGIFVNDATGFAVTTFDDTISVINGVGETWFAGGAIGAHTIADNSYLSIEAVGGSTTAGKYLIIRAVKIIYLQYLNSHDI